MIMKPKIGLVTTMSLDDTWPESTVREVTKYHRKAYETLNKIGMETIIASERITRTKEEMVHDARVLREKGVEMVVVYVGTWTYSNMAALLADIVKVPILVWADSGKGRIGIIGAAITRGALDEVGIKTKLIHGGFDDPETLEKLRKWCTGAAGAVRLRGMTLGVGGKPLHGHVYHACGSE